MNKNITKLVMLIAFGQSVAAQTYYYRYTKSIIKGVTNTDVSGGQFITFDGKKCFESDKYGNNVGNGSMAYDAENSRQVETYWGSCYWSKNAYMKFNADKSLMNIETNAGKIYVYKRATAPANVTTCSLIREPEPSGGGGGGSGGYTPPVYTDQPNYPQGGYGSGGTTIDPGGGTTPVRPERVKREKVRRTCSACNGKGTYEKNGSAVSFGTATHKIRCNVCGYEYWNTQTHSHPSCPTCHGRGYIEEWM